MDNYKYNYNRKPMPTCRPPVYSDAHPCSYEKRRVNSGVESMPIAMAYVPWQQWREIYEPCKVLMAGTIFKELDLPFMERSCLIR